MGKFQYEWWSVDIQEATGKTSLEVKAKNREGAIRQIKKYAEEHTKEIQRFRPDFVTIIYWETMVLDRKGYQRRF